MPRAETIRVLVVDDEALVAERIVGLLEERGYTVVGKAVDGQQAVDMTLALTPDVILLDLRLPGMGGLDAARAIGGRRPTPIVVLTAFHSPELVEDATAAGVGAFLVKPPNAAELDRAITVAMARFKDLLELRRLSERLMGEAARRQRRDMEYQAIQSTTLDGFWMVNLEGRFLEVNQAAAEMLGYTREAMLTMAISDIEARESREETARHLRVLQERCYERFKTVHRRRDGGLIDVEVSALFLSDQERCLVFARDITDQRRMAEDYETLFQQMLDGFALHEILCDGAGRPVDYRFLRVNPAFERMTGLSAQQILGKTVLEVMPGTERHWIETYGEVALTGKPVHFESHSGEMGRFFEVTAFRPAAKQFACIFQDITQRRQAAMERERLLAALEQSGEAVLITDPAGAIGYVNRAFEEATGYYREEVMGQTPRLLKSGEHDEAFYAHLWSIITGGGVFQGRMVNRRKDGTTYSEDASISPVFDAAGDIVNFVAVKRDVTKQIQLEEQLRMSQKLEAIGSLAGGVAHDFNNLLAVILGYTGFALGKTLEGDSLRADILEIQKATERAARLTQQLLAFGRKQMLKPLPLSLNQVARGLEPMLRRILGEDIHMVLALATDLGVVRADPSQVEQVFMNLVANARDAMPMGGTLTVETANVELEAEEAMERVALTPGSYVMLGVTDTGCGMDDKTQGRVFDPFFSTKGKGKGTGLGLSTVYGIVKQSGGNIWVCSELGLGTTFTIYLPRDTGDGNSEVATTAHVSSKPTAGPALVLGRETILLVEDEPALRQVTARALEVAGYTVLVASSGEEAMEVSEGHAGQIHLLFTDVVMPKMHGKELALALVKTRPTMKVLYMSGYTDNAIVHHGVLDSEARFLAKPFDASSLTRIVRQILDGDLR